MSKYVYSYSFGKDVYSFQAESLQTVLQELLEVYEDGEIIKDLSVISAEDGGCNVSFTFDNENLSAFVPNNPALIEEFVSCLVEEGATPYYFKVVEVV